MDDEKARQDGLSPDIRDEVNRILAKDPNELTLLDKEFLRARADYIKEKHKERLPDVFSSKQAKKDKKELEKKAEEEAAAAEERQREFEATPYDVPQTEEVVEETVNDDEEDEEDEAEG